MGYKYRQRKLSIMKRSKAVLLMAATISAVIVSGCTSEPSANDLQTQADQKQEEVMERMQQNAISMDISAVFESEGESVLQIRNTGTSTISTGNISVSVANKNSECRTVEDLAPGNLYDCETSIEFPGAGETVTMKVQQQGTSLSTYNCTVESVESVAC
jgi:outer membrane murein-binding lipoprotein Lpp